MAKATDKLEIWNVAGAHITLSAPIRYSKASPPPAIGSFHVNDEIQHFIAYLALAPLPVARI
jgi:hypothetical protein